MKTKFKKTLHTRLYRLEVAVPQVVHDQVVALRLLGAIVRVEHRGDRHLQFCLTSAIVPIGERLYRVVQLNFTPEIEVLYLFLSLVGSQTVYV